MRPYLGFLVSPCARTMAEIAQQPGQTGPPSLLALASPHDLLEVLHPDGSQGPSTQHLLHRLCRLLIGLRGDLVHDFSQHVCLLLVQSPSDQQQLDDQTCSFNLFQTQDMHLQKRLHAFKEQFDLPTRSVEPQDPGSRPVLLKVQSLHLRSLVCSCDKHLVD